MNGFITAQINQKQLGDLIRNMNMTQRELLNLVRKVFNSSTKNFAGDVINKVNAQYKIPKKKLKRRIIKYVVSELKDKIFSGFFRTGLNNWRARQTKKGVTYGYPTRKLREHAFFAVMPEGGELVVKRTGRFRYATKGRYQGQKREELQKQVTEAGEIDEIITPILVEETELFYKLFKKDFERQVARIYAQG